MLLIQIFDYQLKYGINDRSFCVASGAVGPIHNPQALPAHTCTQQEQMGTDDESLGEAYQAACWCSWLRFILGECRIDYWDVPVRIRSLVSL
jgi:hypothetical protein